MTVLRLRARTYLVLGACSLPFILACGAVLAPDASPDASDASPDAIGAPELDAGDEAAMEKDGSAHADASGDAIATTDGGPAFDGGVTCAPPPPPMQLPPAASASGTRLTLRTLGEAAPIGVQVPEDVFDTALGRRCFPLPYVDGTIRCVPELDFETPLFADPAGTQPIALVPLSPAPVPGAPHLTTPSRNYGYPRTDPFDCANAVQVDALGAQRSSLTYYRADGTMGVVDPAYFALYDLVPFAPNLATLQGVDTRLAGDIAIRELHGADGSRLFAQYLDDTRHGVTVSVSGGHCLPPRASAAGHLSPPPGGAATTGWCGAPDPIFWPGCGAPAFVSNGAQTFAVTLQTRTLYSCDFDMEGILDGFHSSAVPLLISCGALPFTDWTAAPALTLGNARLKTQAVSIAGAPFVPPVRTYGQHPVETGQRETDVIGRTFFDSSLGIACAAAPSSEDGLTHCFPQAALRGAYSDAACTQPIAAGDQVPASSYAMVAAGSDAITHAFSVGAPLGQMHAFYTPDAFSSCSYVDYTAAQPFYAFAATALPASTFAEMQLRSVP